MKDQVQTWIIAMHDAHCRQGQLTACYWVGVGCLAVAWWIQFGR